MSIPKIPKAKIETARIVHDVPLEADLQIALDAARYAHGEIGSLCVRRAWCHDPGIGWDVFVSNREGVWYLEIDAPYGAAQRYRGRVTVAAMREHGIAVAVRAEIDRIMREVR